VLNIYKIKEDMEQEYQKASKETSNLECKYGFNEQDGFLFNVNNMTLEDRIIYESNKQVKYILFYFLTEYINPEFK